MDNTMDARKLKALADASRWGIIRLLLDGPKTVSDLNLDIEIEQSLLSHHLKILRDEGLVEGERRGKCVFYRLAKNVRLMKRRKGLDLGCCQILIK
ncbi:ArsR/SmtB family transcription factor [Kaarinaea lacus]